MTFMKKYRAAGIWPLLLAAVFAVVSFIRYFIWAQANYAMNNLVLIGLAAGFAVNVMLFVIDSDYLIILLTVLYSIALLQLVVDSVGSFVDAYQGIVMFGDPTQVGAILILCALIGAGVLCVIISGFMQRRRPTLPA
ncbi:MAG: hypothetical protein AB9836_01040 [Aminipila sp.]